MRVDAEALYTANHRRLFRYFCRAVGHVETARDLTQDVFVRIGRSAIPDGPEGPLRGWVFQIARNLALDHHRSGQRRPPHEALTDVATRPASQDTGAEVNEALASLADLTAFLAPDQRIPRIIVRGSGERHSPWVHFACA